MKAIGWRVIAGLAVGGAAIGGHATGKYAYVGDGAALVRRKHVGARRNNC
jgi:hypothetical protein